MIYFNSLPAKMKFAFTQALRGNVVDRGVLEKLEVSEPLVDIAKSEYNTKINVKGPLGEKTLYYRRTPVSKLLPPNLSKVPNEISNIYSLSNYLNINYGLMLDTDELTFDKGILAAKKGSYVYMGQLDLSSPVPEDTIARTLSITIEHFSALDSVPDGNVLSGSTASALAKELTMSSFAYCVFRDTSTNDINLYNAKTHSERIMCDAGYKSLRISLDSKYNESGFTELEIKYGTTIPEFD